MTSYIHTSQKLVDSKMKELSKLADTIQTKDRLIQINENNYQEKKKN